MKGTYLRFYMHENRKYHHILLYEWLLEEAKKIGIGGGSVFRGIAGFGRHGVIHEEHFFELAGDLPIEVEFLVSDADAERILEMVKQARIRIVYVRAPVEYFMTEGEH
ncbi:MAG TPA: DUF190 domain-containing protein [Burkholderiales bacterium]|nr:DUF190 domain-containing protein [Burkholderiales bacterium]